ncbi:hypothetical protein PICMEDRAFT_14360 [Pichia membranifaciens NRRL Y-2026]|uniref:Dolichyl-diphosphooligosaccharide-protein glycosyltransferase subunit OST5 n=1 Tax=Pichia membranifaciens NRRL Y-2026 TaxID=763406 RepID=A0A1E3NRX0_9ASCO|nr:hypothetical protein PICMEDRAFT_14360 [Pichia membranifaciens NRRL Y-2026]ODQ48830.1 hypothetical protein PICMEDRAFT_14360 [Pichia membranifaciens NRRL Y-2026]
MTSFNQLMGLYRSYDEFHPEFTANISGGLLILISLISILILMITLAYNAKTSSIKGSIVNFITYTLLAAVAALTISFSVLFVASHLGVYT